MARLLKFVSASHTSTVAQTAGRTADRNGCRPELGEHSHGLVYARRRSFLPRLLLRQQANGGLFYRVIAASAFFLAMYWFWFEFMMELSR